MSRVSSQTALPVIISCKQLSVHVCPVISRPVSLEECQHCVCAFASPNAAHSTDIASKLDMVGAAEGTLVGDRDGTAVGGFVGVCVGTFDGFAVGASDGPAVGDNEGCAVGTSDGDAVGVGVGVADGAALGASVGDGDGAAVTHAPLSQIPVPQSVPTAHP